MSYSHSSAFCKPNGTYPHPQLAEPAGNHAHVKSISEPEFPFDCLTSDDRTGSPCRCMPMPPNPSVKSIFRWLLHPAASWWCQSKPAVHFSKTITNKVNYTKEQWIPCPTSLDVSTDSYLQLLSRNSSWSVHVWFEISVKHCTTC